MAPAMARSGRNKEAKAIEIILPKLALVVIEIYFIVLANVVRPSSTPLKRTARSRCTRIMSAASWATSTAPSTEIPTSASCNAGASLMPSPR